MKRCTQLAVMMGLGTSLLAGAALAQGSSRPPTGMTGPPSGMGSGGMGSGGMGSGGMGSGGMGGMRSPMSGPSGGMSMAPGAGGGAGDAGAISNVQSETTLSSSTTEFSDEGALPNTGGAPWLMVLAGSLTAGGAFLLRRKLA